MSGKQPERGRGRGQGRGDPGPGGRGRGSQYQVPTFESRGGRGGRGGFRDDRGGSGHGGAGRGGRGGPMGKDLFSHGLGDFPQPIVKVRQIENETAKAIQLKKTPGLKVPPSDTRLPLRPGYGTQGREVTLWANYFDMAVPMSLALFRYSIAIKTVEKGNEPTGKKAKRIIQLLIEEHFPQFQNSIATDYKSNLICRVEIPLTENEYQVRYRLEGEDEPSQNAKSYVLRVQKSGTLAVSDLMNYLTSSQASALFESKDQVIQALNIVMGHYPKTAPNIFSVGANKHFGFDSERASLGAGLQVLRGFFVSVRSATSRILLNVQVKHAACYEEGPLDRVMRAYLSQNDQSMVRLDAFLKRVRIRVRHISRKNKSGIEIPRIKTIDRLANRNDGHNLSHPPKVPRFAAGPKEVEFFLNSPGEQPSGSQQGPAGKGKKGKKPAKEGPAPSGRYISVYDFFRTTYGITIHDPSMPVVNVGNRENPSYLPADVCDIEPGQPSRAKLSRSQTQQMINFAVRRPAENARSIIAGGTRLLGIEPPLNPTLNDYGIAVTPKLIAVPGRILVGPDVKYGTGKTVKTLGGSWNMLDVQFTTKTKLSSWTYLLLSPQHMVSGWGGNEHTQYLKPKLDALQAKLKRVGIDVINYTPGLRTDFTQDNVEAKIDESFRKFCSHPTRDPPKLVLVIIPHVDSIMYNRIKFVCDVKLGLLNVCTLANKFLDANDQYFANVALKFNLKLGGRNQYIDKAKLGIISEGKTMVVGIDVTHPSPGSAGNAPSVAGIVASVDQFLGQWPADLRIQRGRQEMVSELDIMFKSRLNLWVSKNKGSLPDNILIYRDGVSEGQYDIVLDQELPLLRRACKEVYPAGDSAKGLPRMSIIIVGKRHHTRFYPTKEDHADRGSNPHNGTVVDRGVTEARNWDFYLQAHSAIKGTARPAHYYTVLDEIFRSRKAQPPFQNVADALEDLTHNMCYMFGRATKAVSICPPAYYADLVCERARCYLSKIFDVSPGATPGGSVLSGEGGGPVREPDPNDVRIHNNVRDAMFYI